MSFWSRDPHESDAEWADSLAHAPSGGRLKQWLVGAGVALIPFGYGIECLVTGRATFFGQNGSTLHLSGSGAVALAVAYLAVGAFIHAHWFWGLHPRLHPWSPLLKLVALVVFLGALGVTVSKVVFA